jgi:uncharacterized membrane protein YkvA (DUF1232 family)
VPDQPRHDRFDPGDAPPAGDRDGPRADLLLDGILHPGEVDRFVAGAVPTAADELPGLRLRVLAHLARVDELGRRQPRVDTEAAQRIAAVLVRLCDEPDQIDDRGRALLRGAIEYFVLETDEVDDVDDVIGFDDDARVVNAVTAALGRQDLRISL